MLHSKLECCHNSTNIFVKFFVDCGKVNSHKWCPWISKTKDLKMPNTANFNIVQWYIIFRSISLIKTPVTLILFYSSWHAILLQFLITWYLQYSQRIYPKPARCCRGCHFIFNHASLSLFNDYSHNGLGMDVSTKRSICCCGYVSPCLLTWCGICSPWYRLEDPGCSECQKQ